jgi:hypothetical protein
MGVKYFGNWQKLDEMLKLFANVFLLAVGFVIVGMRMTQIL